MIPTNVQQILTQGLGTLIGGLIAGVLAFGVWYLATDPGLCPTPSCNFLEHYAVFHEQGYWVVVLVGAGIGWLVERRLNRNQ